MTKFVFEVFAEVLVADDEGSESEPVVDQDQRELIAEALWTELVDNLRDDDLDVPAVDGDFTVKWQVSAAYDYEEEPAA